MRGSCVSHRFHPAECVLSSSRQTLGALAALFDARCGRRHKYSHYGSSTDRAARKVRTEAIGSTKRRSEREEQYGRPSLRQQFLRADPGSLDS
jgi:hypothetical protein